MFSCAPLVSGLEGFQCILHMVLKSNYFVWLPLCECLDNGLTHLHVMMITTSSMTMKTSRGTELIRAISRISVCACVCVCACMCVCDRERVQIDSEIRNDNVYQANPYNITHSLYH